MAFHFEPVAISLLGNVPQRVAGDHRVAAFRRRCGRSFCGAGAAGAAAIIGGVAAISAEPAGGAGIAGSTAAGAGSAAGAAATSGSCGRGRGDVGDAAFDLRRVGPVRAEIVGDHLFEAGAEIVGVLGVVGEDLVAVAALAA